MEESKKISRKDFIYQASLLGAAASLLPLGLSGNPLDQQKKIRVGVIGCGSVSTQYLPHLSKSPYVELVSTCDIIVDRAKAAAEKYGIKNHYPSIEKMLAGAPIDLMVNLQAPRLPALPGRARTCSQDHVPLPPVGIQ